MSLEGKLCLGYLRLGLDGERAGRVGGPRSRISKTKPSFISSGG